MEGTYNERKLRILKAAKRVVAEQGFHKMTFRQVAAEAGISPGTLYYYYNSKNLILYDILDYSQSEAARIAEQMQNDSIPRQEVAARLTQILNEQVKDITGNRMFLHLMHESLSGDNELAEKINIKYDSWLGSIDKIIQLYFGIPASPYSRSVAILLNAAIDGMGLAEMIGVETVGLPQIQQLFQQLLEADISKLGS